MKKTIGSMLGVCMMGLASMASATQTWIVIGDSIVSNVPQGQAKDMALNLVGAERDVIFKSIASPGAAMGMTDNTGFYNTSTLNTINQLYGFWGAYDGIIIQAGTNDFGRNVPWTDTANSTKAIIAKAKAHGKKVLVLDPIWRAGEDTPNTLGNTLNTYRFFMATECMNEPTVCKFAHRENTVMGTSAGSAYYDSAEVAAGTQLHPNVAGHCKLATWIKLEAAAAGFF